MHVTPLVVGAFQAARARYQELNATWIGISARLGAALPRSLLMVSIQRSGELDLVLRCMEDDFQSIEKTEGDVAFLQANYLMMLSEIWTGGVYQIFRLFEERKEAPDNQEFRDIYHELRLLRVPLEKHQIAQDRKLPDSPLVMQRHPPQNNDTDRYDYVKGDPARSHIMPTGLSERRSAMWQVIDLSGSTPSSRWVERRAISDRIIALLGTPPT